MIMPTAYELHVARELALVGGSVVVAGGAIGGIAGALNPEQDGWGPTAVRGVMWGCIIAFVAVLLAGSS